MRQQITRAEFDRLQTMAIITYDDREFAIASELSPEVLFNTLDPDLIGEVIDGNPYAKMMLEFVDASFLLSDDPGAIEFVKSAYLAHVGEFN